MKTRLATYRGEIPPKLPPLHVLRVRELLVLRGIPTAAGADRASKALAAATDAPMVCLGPGLELDSLSEADLRTLGWVKAASGRDDGLTDDEGAVMDALCDAAKAFGRLERQHPDEGRDFCDGIHRCQDTLALLIARRAFPKGWPTYQ